MRASYTLITTYNFYKSTDSNDAIVVFYMTVNFAAHW